MSETSASLLERLRDDPDDQSWQRLVDLYTPLIRGWLRRQATLQTQDADDLVQDVLSVVVRRIPEFHRQRCGSFRAWLRSITVNCLRDFWRSRGDAIGGSNFQQVVEQLQDDDSGMSAQWDQEHDRYITQRLLEMIQSDFQPQTWRAFQRVALDGASPDAAAAELGMSVNAVFIAKSRVLARLRQAGKGLID